MSAGAILEFNDNESQPSARVALANGDHLYIGLDSGGLTIEKDGTVLFKTDPDTVSKICAGLDSSTATKTPLRILVGVILHLSSAEKVCEAFNQAADDLAQT